MATTSVDSGVRPIRSLVPARMDRLPWTVGLTQTPIDFAAEAEEQLRGFVTVALGTADGVECTAIKGNAVGALLAASNDAQLMVIGEPRPGRLASVRASLVAPQVLHRAHCPVVALPAVAAEANS